MKPLKKFGQNFLTDQNIIKKIVELLNPREGETIIEIGPGRGALTKLLNDSGAEVTAIEIDSRVIDELRSEFESVNFIEADFLKFDLDRFESNNLRVVGNIPYNITSPILFKLFEKSPKLQDALLMMQDEVAKRLTAKPRSKDYGILSVLSEYYANVKYCFKISPNVFYPKPKVSSAVVKLEFDRSDANEFDAFFNSVVKASFGNRRKTLKNSLKNSIFGDCDFTKISLDLTKRAEEFSLDDFLRLASELRKLTNGKKQQHSTNQRRNKN